MRRYLNLVHGSGDEWLVQYRVGGQGAGNFTQRYIGKVCQIGAIYWAIGNDGERSRYAYPDKWSAAKHLAFLERLDLDDTAKP